MTNIPLSILTAIPLAPAGFKSGFVAIIGRPNVGKSTLMNELIGQKIAITSPVAQTTRNRLQGILTTSTAQIIFVDTPGIHKPHHELGKVLVTNAKMAISDVDLVLFLVDSSVPAGRGDEFIVNLLDRVNSPVILGLNKCDLQSAKSQTLDDSYRELIGDKNWDIVKFSATEKTGIDQLQETLINRLSEGPYYYPPDLVTDQPERFIMGELIREQILLNTREEVPHSVAIVIERVEESAKLTKVYAAITVERESQKGILIGKKGQMLKEIGTNARQQIQKLIAGSVHLELFVKVEPKWRESPYQLSELGYKIDKG